jgi:hypothetical protein
MRYLVRTSYLLPLAALLVVAAGCAEPDDEGAAEPTPAETTPPETAPEEATPEEAAGPEAGADVQHARALWTEIKGYADWPVPEGFTGWQEGKSPHGAVLKYYVNQAAQGDLTADGAVIVKENYSEQSDDALKSVTVMEKRAGYDPETGNWFYVKYAPDGTVAENPKGMPLAGLVGKGGEKGCVPCHAAAAGDDYLFMND